MQDAIIQLGVYNKKAATDGKAITKVNSFELANVACKALFKQQKWSDIYYTITFADGKEVVGAIDIEPESHFKPFQGTIFTTHLKTFWTNVSKAKPIAYITQNDIDECASLLSYLPEWASIK